MVTVASSLTPACLDDEAIAAAIEVGLAALADTGAEAHLADCGFCRARLTELARIEADESQGYVSLVADASGTGRAPPGADVGAMALVPGATVGRYVILARVGAGGMGVVYSAYDPELDRRIAIKVIRHDTVGLGDDGGAHLRREARAMARLTHPNVVRVYDVGAQSGLVYIAMEFVVGADLERVLRDRRLPWRRALDVCLAAGRGLVAAHDAGLVHRDIKPSNILCADDGDVLIADFGLTALSRAPREPRGDAGVPHAARGTGDAHDRPAGGTPGFAAPEQLAGAVCDARSDQYSFCATVVRCLGEGVPPAVARVLARGMAIAPDQRFASIRDLLAALTRAAHRRRRRVIAALVSIAVVTTVGATFVAGGSFTGHDRAAVCEASARRFAALWDPPRRTALINALPPADRARDGYFLAAVDSRAASLRQAESHACQASQIDRVTTASAYDRQVFCLGIEAAKLEAVIAMVAAGGSIDDGHKALDDVRGGDACNLGDGLLNTAPPPTGAEAVAGMADVERMMGEQLALTSTSRGQAALERARAAVALAERIGYPPLSARAYMAESNALSGLEREQEAYHALERARDAAIIGRDDPRLVVSLVRLASVSLRLDRLDQAEAHLSTATALAQARAIAPAIRLGLRTVVASLAQLRNTPDRALAELDAAMLELPSVADADERQLLEIRMAQVRAGALTRSGDPARMVAALQRATELIEQRFGPRYSGLASQYINVGLAQFQAGDMRAARAMVERAQALLTDPSASKEQLARSWQLDGMIKRAAGNSEQALASYTRELEVTRSLFGEDHRKVWGARNDVAVSWTELGRWSEAATFFDEYLSWARTKQGETSTEAQNARLNLADAIISGHLTSEYPRAGTLLAEALAAAPPTSELRVHVVAAEGLLRFAEGKFTLAAERLGSARALANGLKHVAPTLLAHIIFEQAEALWGAHQRPAALRAAEDALAMYRDLPQRPKQLEQVTAWLAARKNR